MAQQAIRFNTQDGSQLTAPNYTQTYGNSPVYTNGTLYTNAPTYETTGYERQQVLTPIAVGSNVGQQNATYLSSGYQNAVYQSTYQPATTIAYAPAPAAKISFNHGGVAATSQVYRRT
jgi:hypothetical protein